MIRKKITTGAKVKMFRNQVLNGETYCNMIVSYVKAINEGKIPNLNDTWTFIRQERARKVVDGVREHYQEKLRTRIGSRLPIISNKLN